MPVDNRLIKNVPSITTEEKQKKRFQEYLQTLPFLPKFLRKSLPDRLETLPNELVDLIGSQLAPEELEQFKVCNRRTYALFQPKILFGKFLERVAYGQQEKVEQLLANVFKGQAQKVQAALRHKGTFTDYSGRTFNCTAYEYAYWAMDTDMCRMFERHMDEDTKEYMLERINMIKESGLSYKQNGMQYRSAHFDFTPLIQALKAYSDKYKSTIAGNNPVGLSLLWDKVGIEQRNVPAHVAQQYCQLGVPFSPCPEFSESTLRRTFQFYNWKRGRSDFWYPLDAEGRGLGFDFTIGRDVLDTAQGGLANSGAVDLAAITRLKQVRTEDLVQSRKNLSPCSVVLKMGR